MPGLFVGSAGRSRAPPMACPENVLMHNANHWHLHNGNKAEIHRMTTPTGVVRDPAQTAHLSPSSKLTTMTSRNSASTTAPSRPAPLAVAAHLALAGCMALGAGATAHAQATPGDTSGGKPEQQLPMVEVRASAPDGKLPGGQLGRDARQIGRAHA